jgi:multidrug efflux pump subunit AcrA (membrane-fusion protein)
MNFIRGWAMCLALLLPLSGFAQDTPPKEAPAKTPAETLDVKSGLLRTYETVKARVEASATVELRTTMDVFPTLIVEQIAAPGTIVKQGDVVLKFKTDKIEQQLRDAKYELDVANLNLKEAENNFNQVVATYELDHRLAQDAWDHKQQDVDYYLKVTAPFSARRVKKNLESSGFQVEYAQDELDQLEKMYKEDELTEESEQMVLKRAQRSLDQAKFYLEAAQINADHELGVELPRESDQQAKALQRAELEFKKAMITIPSQRQVKELELEKQRFALEKQQREYNKLAADLERMTLRAPIDGIVYHGQARRGVWSNAAGGGSRMIEVGATIAKDMVAMTIVDSGSLRLRGDLEEKQLAGVRVGSAGIARPTANSDASFEVNVAQMGTVPVDEAKFDCVMESKNLPKGLIAGMSCEVKFLTYEKKDAVLAPKASVYSDDDGQSHYVFVPDGTESQRRDVKVGKTKDDKMEIVSGLKAGEKILKTKPE